jgi:hypothetical protein
MKSDRDGVRRSGSFTLTRYGVGKDTLVFTMGYVSITFYIGISASYGTGASDIQIHAHAWSDDFASSYISRK